MRVLFHFCDFSMTKSVKLTVNSLEFPLAIIHGLPLKGACHAKFTAFRSKLGKILNEYSSFHL